MKNYEKPTVEIVKINDVITTSNGLMSTVTDSELLGNDNVFGDSLWDDEGGN